MSLREEEVAESKRIEFEVVEVDLVERTHEIIKNAVFHELEDEE